VAFFVRKERKEHGLQRWIEGPLLEPGTSCLVVEDVVTTGGSTIQAIERVKEAGHAIAGVVSVLDRLAGGGEAIEAAADAPYRPLTAIDDVYPDRPG
jgi:orotate phosphoribosyltransferase